MILARPAEHMIVMVNLLVHAKKRWKQKDISLFRPWFRKISAGFGLSRPESAPNRPVRLISARIGAESAWIVWFRPESEPNLPESSYFGQNRSRIGLNSLISARIGAETAGIGSNRPVSARIVTNRAVSARIGAGPVRVRQPFCRVGASEQIWTDRHSLIWFI